jgi:hypothetical protein
MMKHKLKVYLTVNSIFSAKSGIIMLIFSNGLNIIFGINNSYVFPIIGLNLILFSAFVWFVYRKHLTNRLLVHIISGLDVLWVIGSLLIIFLKLFDLSKTGYIIIGIVGIWIGFLGYMQFINNK